MAVSHTDVEDLLVTLDRGRQAWIDGELGFGPGLDAEQDPDMTIFGPSGSEAGQGPALPERQQAMARLLKGGTGETEVVKTVVSGDVVVVVLVERNEVTVEGVEQPQRWVLRPHRSSNDEVPTGCAFIATPTRSSTGEAPPTPSRSRG